MKQAIYLSLSGVLLDLSERYYQVYLDILKELGLKALKKDEFWMLLREGVPWSLILQRSGSYDKIKNFYHAFNELIESPAYWRFDRPWGFSKNWLEEYSDRFSLVLVEIRRRTKELFSELDAFNWRKYFSLILTSEDFSLPGWKVKANLIEQCPYSFKRLMVIGDSENEIWAGRLLNIPTGGFLSGITSRERLFQIKPDYIFYDLRGFSNLLKLFFDKNNTPFQKGNSLSLKKISFSKIFF